MELLMPADANSLNPAWNMMGAPGDETLEEQLRMRKIRDKVFMTGAIPTWYGFEFGCPIADWAAPTSCAHVRSPLSHLDECRLL